jgi:superoxide dismutase, Fe-Mn family
MTYQLPELGYDYNSLEPFIDEETMKIHHSKHHQAYVDKLNKALAETELGNKPIKELIKDLDNLPEDIQTAVRNNGGGHLNHTFFWKLLKKNTSPGGEVLEAIEKEFGSFEEFKRQFTESSITLFGSGWNWLVINNGKLEIIKTQNQDSPLTLGKNPLLGIDVWEHAYYLKYQNKRPEYLDAFFNVINWDQVNENYNKAK